MKLFSTALFATTVVAQIDYLNYGDYTYNGSNDYGLDASPADYGILDADFFTPEILELLESADEPDIGARALGTSAKKQLPPGIKIGDFFENGVFNAVKFRAALREAQQAAAAQQAAVAAAAQQVEFEAAAAAQEAAEAAAAEAAAELAAAQAAAEATAAAAAVEAAAQAAAVEAAVAAAAEAAIQAAAAATTQAPARTIVLKTKDDRARPSLSDTFGAVMAAANNAGNRGFIANGNDYKFCRKCDNLTPAACATAAVVESCDDSNPLDADNICAVRFTTTYNRDNGAFVESVTTGCKNRRACVDNMSQNFVGGDGTKHLGQQCRPREAANKRFAHDSVCHYCSKMSDLDSGDLLLFSATSPTGIPIGDNGQTLTTLDALIKGDYISVGDDGKTFGLNTLQTWYSY